MTNNRNSRPYVQQSILLTLKIVRDIVQGWADGSIPAPALVFGAKPSDVRIAPSFTKCAISVNSGPALPGLQVLRKVVPTQKQKPGVRYTVRNITDAIEALSGEDMTSANVRKYKNPVRRASRYIIVAVLLAEAFEEGWADEDYVTACIKQRQAGFTLLPLWRRLVKRERLHASTVCLGSYLAPSPSVLLKHK